MVNTNDSNKIIIIKYHVLYIKLLKFNNIKKIKYKKKIKKKNTV